MSRIESLDENEGSELLPLPLKRNNARQKWGFQEDRTCGEALIWKYLTAVFLAMTIAASSIAITSRFKFSYLNGFETELSNAISAVKIQQVNFTGGLKYNDQGFLYRDNSTERITYVGTPSPSIDRAWNELTAPHWVRLDSSTVNDLYIDENGSIITGLDVFHQLHCLNQIRMGLYTDYYSDPKTSVEYHQMHIDHCLDYLRQTIQCHGDMTRIKLVQNEHSNTIIPSFETTHTCRNFDALHEWSVKHIFHIDRHSKP